MLHFFFINRIKLYDTEIKNNKYFGTERLGGGCACAHERPRARPCFLSGQPGGERAGTSCTGTDAWESTEGTTGPVHRWAGGHGAEVFSSPPAAIDRDGWCGEPRAPRGAALALADAATCVSPLLHIRRRRRGDDENSRLSCIYVGAL